METQDISEKYISMIQKINLDYQETLEIDYKTPKIKGNYKGNQEEEIKPYHCPNKLVSIAEIQKDPKLFYLFNESSLLPSGGGSGMETEPSGGQGQGGQGGVGVRPISKKMNPSSSGGAGAGNGSVASSSSSSSSPPPEMMRGWMKKQGHQFKTIKRRYFVLENGELKYYEKPLAAPPYGEKLKGSFPLKDGTVEFGAGDGKPLGKDGNQRLYIQALVCHPLSPSLPSLPPPFLPLDLSVSGPLLPVKREREEEGKIWIWFTLWLSLMRLPSVFSSVVVL
jgi:hypothetical protein